MEINDLLKVLEMLKGLGFALPSSKGIINSAGANFNTKNGATHDGIQSVDRDLATDPRITVQDNMQVGVRSDTVRASEGNTNQSKNDNRSEVRVLHKNSQITMQTGVFNAMNTSQTEARVNDNVECTKES